MNLAKVIEMADELRDNEVPPKTKAVWIYALDGQLRNDVVSLYEDELPWPDYDEDEEPENFEAYDTMIPAPYDGMYVNYLVARIDLYNGDIDRYNNEAALFERQKQDWANYYNRTHRWRNPTPGLRF